MVPAPTIARDLENYRGLAYYDRLYLPRRVEEGVKSSQTLPGSSSVMQEYTVTLVQLLGFTETSSLSTNPIEWMIKKQTDEELWLSLIGIFESGDPHFAEHHNQIYGRQT